MHLLCILVFSSNLMFYYIIDYIVITFSDKIKQSLIEMKMSLGEGQGAGNTSMEYHAGDDMGGHNDNMSLDMGHTNDGHGEGSHEMGHTLTKLVGHALASMLGSHEPSGKQNMAAYGHKHAKIEILNKCR